MPSIIIMAGGVGKRFWPASRKDNPKQFLALTGEKTMLRETVDRVSQIVHPKNIFIVTTSNLAEKAAQQLEYLPEENIIVEPEGRNTAPCVALAMAAIRSRYGMDEVVAILPADHKIGEQGLYLEILKEAFTYIQVNNEVLTFGIKPNRPETGYGYIEFGSCVHKKGNFNANTGIRFVEKPDLERAEEYLMSGRYLWNSGMFVMKTGTFMELCAKHLPEVFKEVKNLESNLANRYVLKEIYSRLPKISFDNGIMEKLDSFVVVPADFGWDDLGSWLALENNLPQDQNYNVVAGEFIGVNAENNIIFGNGKQVVSAVGVRDLIIVVRDDVIMVCPKNSSQNIKILVEEIKMRGREDLL
jgi:mannose-1-phosphate guanylyltransferase